MRGRSGERIRVATFNIKHAAAKYGYRGLPDQLAQSCAELEADVLALQEVDVGVPRSRHADLARVAAEACGMSYYFAKARKHAYRGQYGNALLVRGSIADVDVVRLAGDHRHNLVIGPVVLKPFREPRNAIVATARVRGQAISIGTGHFACEPHVRHSQLARAAGSLVSRPGPRILCGDFNIASTQAAEWLEPYGLHLAQAQLDPADPSARPDIDHVAVSGFVVHRVETRWLSVSDHPAKIADVTVA
ncbi:MAG: endonuclease/exonuclease/phosphatase family protein [Actinomycetota bacterium]|nr:endonuclease/exonuclease/phosphatase family protein [Actinomycetota bacterium]